MRLGGAGSSLSLDNRGTAHDDPSTRGRTEHDRDASPATGRTCGGRLRIVARAATLALLALLLSTEAALAGGARRALGGRGALRLAEKDLNLDEALRLATFLRGRGAAALLTRERDVGLTLEERISISSAAGAAVFISVHNNGSRDRSRRGCEVYHQVGNSQSQDLARRILDRATLSTGFAPRGIFARPGPHGDYYFLLRHLQPVAVIVEGGYVTNPAEARRLADPQLRQRLAEGIGGAVVEWWESQPGAGPRRAARPVTGTIGLPAPADLRAERRDGDAVVLRWKGVPGANRYRVWRDGVQVGDRTTRPVPLPMFAEEGLSHEDRPGGGAHLYQVQALQEVAGQVLASSPPAALEIVVPLVVIIDPGHGGSDPGAVGRT